MISHTAEYALRAVVCLGNRNGGPLTAVQISDAIDAPSDYLSKVLRGLSRAKIVKSQRGLHGGYSLAVDPSDLSIFDVVQAVDARQRHPACPLDGPAHASGLCPLHMRLERLMAAAEQEFRETSISDLLGNAENDSRKVPCISD